MISISVCVCLCVCLSVCERISGDIRATFTIFLCVFPTAVARSFSGRLTVGGKGVTGVHSAGRSVIDDCVVTDLSQNVSDDDT